LFVALVANSVGTANAQQKEKLWQGYKLLSELDRSGVPVWSDEEILAQFKFIRDEPYLYENGDKTTPKRRLPWLYPDGGCNHRADQACYLIISDANVKKTRNVKDHPPWKIHADFNGGDFSLPTPYVNPASNSGHTTFGRSQVGMASWSGHVAPVVKNTKGELIVLDPALNYCTPLKLEEWLALLAAGYGNNFNIFNDPTGEYNREFVVALSDHRAAVGDDVAIGGTEEQASRNEKESLFEVQRDLFTERTTLENLFWLQNNQERVKQMLGDFPPWAGKSCIATYLGSITRVTPRTATHDVKICPFGTLAVGGGVLSGSDKLPVVGLAKLDDGTEGWWADSNFNMSGVDQEFILSTMCLSGAPAKATVKKVTSQAITVWPSKTDTARATCSSGILVGGGYWAQTQSTTPSSSSMLRVFRNTKSKDQNNTWEVAAYNPGKEGKFITAYAICLQNTKFTVEPAYGTLNSQGEAKASCLGTLHTMGGGFEFPQNKAYTVIGMNNVGIGQFTVTMTPAPASGDMDAKAIAMCLRSEADPASMCTFNTAVDMGASSNKTTTVKGNACLKITNALPSSTKSISLQVQGNGSNYPIPYTWTNCSTTQKQTFTGNGVTNILRTISASCPTLIRLTGSASSRVSLKWWPNS
jgi:hypothetical protein